MKKKFGNFINDNEDSVEFYSSRDILSARTLNRPLLKIFDTEEALTKHLESTIKTLYSKKGNFILPGYLEEFSADNFTTGTINKRNYLRIPTGALVINEKLIFIKPNCESFERELAKAYGLNLNDFDNNITVSYECSNKQLNYKIKTTYISFDTNKTFEISGNSIFEIINNKVDEVYWFNNINPLNQSLELLIDITDLEDGKYNLCYNGKFELSENNENKIAEITFENKEITNCNVLIKTIDLNEIEFYNLKVENDNYSLSINEDGLNITTDITNINSPVNITGDTTLNNLTVNAESVTLGNLKAGNTTLNNLTARDTELNNLTASNTTLDSLKAGDTILNSLTAGNTTLDSLIADTNSTTFDNLTAGNTTLNKLAVSNATLNNLTVNNDTTLNNLKAGDTTLDNLTVENDTTLNSLTVNNDTILNNLTAGDATLDSLTVNAEVVTLNSLKVDKISPKTTNLIINGTADRAIADANGNNIDTTYLKIDDQLCYNYTYIVDSDQKLADWANNVAGNDYTKVLIKSGTWSSSASVNLSTTGTKVVVGEPGNLLKFSTTNGLYYNSIPNSLDYYMTGVNVESIVAYRGCTNLTNCTGTGVGSADIADGNAYGFYSCTNLTNCIGTGNGNDGGLTGIGRGFYGCTNLTNCAGEGSGSNGSGFDNCTNLANCTGTSTGSNSAYAFYICDNLTNCTGNSDNINSNYAGGNISAFYSCDNLTNCTGTSSGMNGSSAFYSCDNLTNCTSTGNGGKTSGRGFDTCTNLTNCTGYGNAAGGGFGFLDCTNLTNCSGKGNGGGAGYGFLDCKGVLMCKKSATCRTGVFSNCYSTLQEDSSYAVANSLNGGFNITTN